MPEQAALKELLMAEDRLLPVNVAPNLPALADVRGARVLIVDDEELVRVTLRVGLTREGYCCQEATNADEAMEIIETSPPEFVLLDVRMPGKSGRELLKEIVSAHPEIAVIMATAADDVDGIVECMKNGAQDYLVKPFTIDKVVRSVGRALRAKRLELRVEEYRRHLEKRVDSQAREIRRLFLGAMESLVFAIEAKDKYTAGHSRRVAELSVALGKELGLSAQDLDDLRWGALLHDAGKIAIDPAVQNKPGRLTLEEYSYVMTHPELGARVIAPVVNARIVAMARHHHDHYDGKGFQQALSGEAIPLGARIIAVADAFDAMTSNRPYRAALSEMEARNEIARCSGTQFDPRIAAAFNKKLLKLLAPAADGRR